MFNYYRHTFFANRFFLIGSGLVVLMAISFVWKVLFYVDIALTFVLGLLLLVDFTLLNLPRVSFLVTRSHAKVISLGDDNPIFLSIKNTIGLWFDVKIIDELPDKLQLREFELNTTLQPNQRVRLQYTIRPTERGVYQFGDVRLFIKSRIGLIERMVVLPAEETVACYPSVIQMKKYDLKAFQRITQPGGIKKMRKLGNSYEFEQIKEYVVGDDYRSINWKATGKMSRLMVEQYEDEKSQQVYCIIDKSRSMLMPFNGLSLLDYAINTTLCLANVALQKQDKVGLISFSHKIDALLKAEKRINQLNSINELLYHTAEDETEANYELLYQLVRYFVKGRSLLLLYTNFESKYALQRVLPVLRKLNKLHLVMVVFFENTELQADKNTDSKDLYDVYRQTLAAHYQQEKFQFLKEINQYGIAAIVTKPEDLTVNTINKYLELKAKRLI